MFIIWNVNLLERNTKLTEFTELEEIEREFNELQLDMQSNTNSILLKPKEMKVKIESYLHTLSSIAFKLEFLKKSITQPEFYTGIVKLEKELIILRNQIELDLKIINKV